MAANEEDFETFCWSITDGEPLLGYGDGAQATTPLSERISKDPKQHGFKFVGPTIVYAWMQATGTVNDHSIGCFPRDEVAEDVR